MADSTPRAQDARGNLTLALGLAALASWVAGVFFTGEGGNENGWIWIVMAVLSLAAVVTGALAFRGGRPSGRTITGLAIGGVLLLVFLAFALGIVE